MSDNVNINPFAGLFSSSSEAESFAQALRPDTPPSPLPNDLEIHEGFTDLEENPTALDRHIQSIFGLLLANKKPIDPTCQLISIESETIEDGLFERLSFPDCADYVVPPMETRGLSLDLHFIQTNTITYLFECWSRLQRVRRQEKDDSGLHDVITLENVVLRAVGIALEDPEIFQLQNIDQQYIDLFLDSAEINNVAIFTEHVVKMLKPEERDMNNVFKTFESMLNNIYQVSGVDWLKV